MPGACLMMSTSGPLEAARHLAVGAAAHDQRAIGLPDPCIAAVNPAAIDSTETKTTTTPAMPMMATRRRAEPRRNRPDIERQHGERLRKPRHVSARLNASVIFSRIAAIAGITPGKQAHQRPSGRRRQPRRAAAARRSAACRRSDRRPARRARRGPRPRSPPVNAMNSDSVSTSIEDRRARKSQRLQDRQLAGPFADRLRHRAGRDESEHEQHRRRDGDHDAADVADLLGETLDESLFRRGLGLGRRVREHLVERPAQLDRLEPDRRS